MRAALCRRSSAERSGSGIAAAGEGRAALVLSYEAYAFDTSVRTAFLDDRRGFFNTTSLCLRVHGREAAPQQLQIGQLPKGWDVATAGFLADRRQVFQQQVRIPGRSGEVTQLRWTNKDGVAELRSVAFELAQTNRREGKKT